MHAKIKKIPKYFFALLTEVPLKDLYLIFKYVKCKHLLRALAGRAKKRPAGIELRDPSFHEILFLSEVRGYRKELVDEDLYRWEVHGKNYYATHIQFEELFLEYLAGIFTDIYAFDWTQKTVLDIGGFIGDSALYFLANGAKHCVICEPLPENVKALHHNLQHHVEKITIIQKALALEEGLVTLYSNCPQGSAEFGRMKGNHQVKCEGTTILTLLQRDRFDVVKLDCEGAEECLLPIAEEVLRSVPYWIIETHGSEIHQNILNKFERSRFEKTRDAVITPTVHVLHFQMR